MKTDYWIIAIVLLLLTAVGGMMRLNTTIGDREELLKARWVETDRLIAHVYWTRISLRPSTYCLPLEAAWVSSGTGYRMDPMGGGTEGLHKGVDLAGKIGASIKAALAGVVVDHWPAPDGYWHGHPIFGGFIVIDHGDELFSLYGHLSGTDVHEGDWVEAGQVIGELGDTGIATGPHLHFEVVVNPLRYLEER